MVATNSTNLAKKDLEEKISKLETDIDNLLQAAAKRAQEMANKPSPSIESKPEPQVSAPPPPKPEPQISAPPQEPQIHQSENTPKSRKEKLADYEKDYLERLANELKEQIEIQRAAQELVAKRHADSQPQQVLTTRGSLPKGF